MQISKSLTSWILSSFHCNPPERAERTALYGKRDNGIGHHVREHPNGRGEPPPREPRRSSRRADARGGRRGTERDGRLPSDGASTFESPPRRPSPLERIMKDPLAAAVMGPRLALGGATEALDLLQKGQLLGVLAQAPGELNTLLQDPRPINDKAEDLVRRAEGMVETLEERGIAAEAPGREIFKAILPADLYDRYLDPAAVGAVAATATQPPQPPPAEYKAEPPTRSAPRTAPATAAEEDDAAVPVPDPVPDPAAAEEEVDEEKGSVPEATERGERGWVFDSDEDPAVIAAARAVASVLDSEEWDEDREAGLYPEVLGGQKPASTSGGDAIAEDDGIPETASPRSVEPAPVQAASSVAPVASGSAPSSVPPELWAAVEEAEKLAADVVMQASTVAARRER